jgi:hypothetical protein
MGRVFTMAEATARPLEELLREVDDTQEAVRVVLEEGHEIEIKPAPKLKPLLTHPGYVPEGWKDAIYEPKPGA